MVDFLVDQQSVCRLHSIWTKHNFTHMSKWSYCISSHQSFLANRMNCSKNQSSRATLEIRMKLNNQQDVHKSVHHNWIDGVLCAPLDRTNWGAYHRAKVGRGHNAWYDKPWQNAAQIITKIHNQISWKCEAFNTITRDHIQCEQTSIDWSATRSDCLCCTCCLQHGHTCECHCAVVCAACARYEFWVVDAECREYQHAVVGSGGIMDASQISTRLECGATDNWMEFKYKFQQRSGGRTICGLRSARSQFCGKILFRFAAIMALI